MNPSPQRSEPLAPATGGFTPLDLTSDQIAVEPTFDGDQWAESRAEERGAGGRQVLGILLIVLAGGWLAFSAWSAGRSLGGASVGSPAFAQWIAVTAAPLALLGLIWLIFG